MTLYTVTVDSQITYALRDSRRIRKSTTYGGHEESTNNAIMTDPLKI